MLYRKTVPNKNRSSDRVARALAAVDSRDGLSTGVKNIALRESEKASLWDNNDAPRKTLSFEESTAEMSSTVQKVYNTVFTDFVLAENEIDSVKDDVIVLVENFVESYVNVRKTYENMTNTIGRVHLLQEEQKEQELDVYLKDAVAVCKEKMNTELKLTESLLNTADSTLDSSNAIIFGIFKELKEENLRDADTTDVLHARTSDSLLYEAIKYHKVTVAFGALPLVLKENVSVREIEFNFTEPLLNII